jgi:hypothetical protein
MGFGFRIAFSGYDGWVEYDFYSDVWHSRSGFGDFNFCNCLQYHQALVCCKEDEFVSLYQKHFAVFRNHYSSFSTFLLLGFFFSSDCQYRAEIDFDFDGLYVLQL